MKDYYKIKPMNTKYKFIIGCRSCKMYYLKLKEKLNNEKFKCNISKEDSRI